MPRYKYFAKINPHDTAESVIEADSQSDAVNKIIKLGYFPVSIKVEGNFLADAQKQRLFKKSGKSVVVFTRQLSTLIDSGVNIINGLNIIINQTTDKYLKAVLEDVVSKIKDGRSLSESLSLHPYIFPDIYTAMILTGEASGSLSDTLKRLADFLEKEDEFRNSLKASTTYPLFVMAVGVMTIAVLMIFVIPRFVTMFNDMGQSLPLPTQILINLSVFMRNYWWLIMVAAGLAFFSFKRFEANPKGRLIWDNFKIKLPWLGGIIVQNEISRFSRTLSLLISSGLPIIQALGIGASVMNNKCLSQEVKDFQEKIRDGLSLSVALKSSKFFPEFVSNIVSVGEETGNLDKTLMRIAIEYERNVDSKVKEFLRLLEPVMILIMGLVVGFIVLSMLLPIFQINLMVK